MRCNATLRSPKHISDTRCCSTGVLPKSVLKRKSHVIRGFLRSNGGADGTRTRDPRRDSLSLRTLKTSGLAVSNLGLYNKILKKSVKTRCLCNACFGLFIFGHNCVQKYSCSVACTEYFFPLGNVQSIGARLTMDIFLA